MSPRRLISEAREVLEESMAHQMSDVQMREANAMLARAEGIARQRAEGEMQRLADQAEDVQQNAHKDLTRIRDAMNDLVQEASVGRISSQEYATRLDQLMRQQDQAEGQLDKADEVLGQLEALEADPVSWFDSLSERIPILRQDFSW